jgi:hypothetical protein
MNRHMPYCSAAPLVPCPPPTPHPRQAYNINIHRTFQLPSVEPLGADWGEAELRALTGAAGRCAAAIRLATGNADPEIAAARRAAAYAISVADALPRGEQRQAVLDKLAEARRMAEEAAAASKLPATMVRAGKVQRRANHRGTDLRGPGQRVVKPLLNRRGSKKRALVDDEAINHGDEFQKRPRKGKETNKVGGVHGGAVVGTCRRRRGTPHIVNAVPHPVAAARRHHARGWNAAAQRRPAQAAQWAPQGLSGGRWAGGGMPAEPNMDGF